MPLTPTGKGATIAKYKCPSCNHIIIMHAGQCVLRLLLSKRRMHCLLQHVLCSAQPLYRCKVNIHPNSAICNARYTREELEMIDNQGRCVITDHGKFVLFNVYGPAVTNELNERFAFKMRFYQVSHPSKRATARF